VWVGEAKSKLNEKMYSRCPLDEKNPKKVERVSKECFKKMVMFEKRQGG
jgi:hypothetical protein